MVFFNAWDEAEIFEQMKEKKKCSLGPVGPRSCRSCARHSPLTDESFSPCSSLIGVSQFPFRILCYCSVDDIFVADYCGLLHAFSGMYRVLWDNECSKVGWPFSSFSRCFTQGKVLDVNILQCIG